MTTAALTELEAVQGKSGEQAIVYVCGYIAKKLHQKAPGLLLSSESKNEATWIDLKSRGSLTYPSNALVNAVKHYENIFMEFHGEDLDRNLNPIERTINQILKKNKNFPAPVVKLYVTLRFFNRLKNLNNRILTKRSKSVRCFKQTAQFMF